jgi:5-methylcytosine-specific restriction endonuclease McrA
MRYYDKDKAREATHKYRKQNREVYLSKHRIRQFNRKKLEKVTSDGSVTDEFVRSVYSSTQCYYCQKIVKREDRTLEHIVPLAGGGKHTSTNIVMACKYCNSAKQDQSEQEFRSRHGF